LWKLQNYILLLILRYLSKKKCTNCLFFLTWLDSQPMACSKYVQQPVRKSLNTQWRQQIGSLCQGTPSHNDFSASKTRSQSRHSHEPRVIRSVSKEEFDSRGCKGWEVVLRRNFIRRLWCEILASSIRRPQSGKRYQHHVTYKQSSRKKGEGYHVT